MESMCSTIRNAHNKFKKSVLWIGGDLNLPNINWTSNSIDGHQNLHDINATLIETIHEFNLDQAVNCPTRQEKTLDIFLSNRPSLINRPVRSKLVKRKIYLSKKANIDNLRASATNFKHDFFRKFGNQSGTSAQEMWDYIKSSLLHILDTKVPSKLASTSYSQPWIDTKARKSNRHADIARYQKPKKTSNLACLLVYKSALLN
ncbi:hypothetical protein MAR_037849 [Mya arenaria]|uniref:Endonuclease/exonuclease/phosphatase domain-containing protein n=1 Tax=Mya arenaria TaxID=6604 RepID=A0ABY7FQ79_MYAAR|nr:hypothetical protein MAR_037849 [Mya arenaria]